MSMSKKTMFFIILVSLFSLITFSLNGYCDDWVLINKNENISSYYNASSIKIDKENKIIKVWVKDVYTEKGRINYLKDLGSIKKSYYEDISYDIVFYLINYNKWQYCTNYLKRYSKSGDELFDHQYPIKWHDIDPGSDGDLLFNKILQVCKIQR
jgi:hypothetical protein